MELKLDMLFNRKKWTWQCVNFVYNVYFASTEETYIMYIFRTMTHKFAVTVLTPEVRGFAYRCGPKFQFSKAYGTKFFNISSLKWSFHISKEKQDSMGKLVVIDV